MSRSNLAQRHLRSARRPALVGSRAALDNRNKLYHSGLLNRFSLFGVLNLFRR
jgi:hypothetical protein